MRSYDSNTESE